MPLSPDFLNELELVFNLKNLKPKEKESFLWSWSRTTAFRRICEVMQSAEIEGTQASPKGLRHSFAIHALERKIPLNLVSKWLGHSSLEVTAIYANALGAEERNIAQRLWI